MLCFPSEAEQNDEKEKDKEKKEKKTKKKNKAKESEDPQKTNKTTKQERKSNKFNLSLIYQHSFKVTAFTTFKSLFFCRETLAGGFNPGNRVSGGRSKSKEE